MCHMVSTDWISCYAYDCKQKLKHLQAWATVVLSCTHFYKIWSLNSWKLLVTPWLCICTEENTLYQGWPDYNGEACQESREVWQSCQSLTLSVCECVCVFSTVCTSLPHCKLSLTVPPYFSLFFFLFLFQPNTSTIHRCYHIILCHLRKCLHLLYMSDRQHIFGGGRYLEQRLVLFWAQKHTGH